MHAGTELGGSVTRIGNHNRFLVGVHLAHDTIVGNHVIIANNVQVAGHVHVEDCVTMGGHAGIHHFVTVGKYAMLGGLSRVITDVPPYVTVLGLPAEVRGLNIEGLKRWGLPDSDISALNDAFRKLFAKRADESTPFTERLEQLVYFNGQNEHVRYFYEFIKRKLSVGNSGRYLESLRKDKREDRGDFFGAALSGE